MQDVNIAIFASGSGTNAQNIIEYILAGKYLEDIKNWDTTLNPKVSLVLSNKKDAFVLQRAANLNVQSMVFSPSQLREPGEIVQKALEKNNIQLVILAGFLLKMPDHLVEQYDRRIINVHPSLLPKYGGKGMYGDKVHATVIAAGENESGITIHLVDHEYDNGTHLFQAKCPVLKEDTAQTLATRIHQLEKDHFPRVICEYIIKLRKESYL